MSYFLKKDRWENSGVTSSYKLPKPKRFSVQPESEGMKRRAEPQRGEVTQPGATPIAYTIDWSYVFNDAQRYYHIGNSRFVYMPPNWLNEEPYDDQVMDVEMD